MGVKTQGNLPAWSSYHVFIGRHNYPTFSWRCPLYTLEINIVLSIPQLIVSTSETHDPLYTRTSTFNTIKNVILLFHNRRGIVNEQFNKTKGKADPLL